MIALLVVVLFPQVAAPAAQNAGPPLREQELLFMVRSRTMFTADQVVELIQTRGIGFRLTDATRKALKKEGAGAAVMAAVEKAADRLKRLSSAEEAKAAAAAAPKPVPPPPPLDGDEQKKLLERVRASALQYTDKLPNFLCLQVTRRFVDPAGTGSFQPYDVIQARLAYYEHKESYQVVQVNEQMTNRSYDSLGGASSTGEFGTFLNFLFRPESRTYFHWVGPASLGDRPVYAWDYEVPVVTSQWHLIWEPRKPEEQSIISGYSGRVIVDAEKEQVLRLWMQADDIPAGFPIRRALTTLDYGYAKIAGQPFLLPARAVVEMKESRTATRNEISFRQYQRFSAEAKLVFEETPPEEPPPPQLQPAKPPAQPTGKQPKRQKP
jgi:hypothetical protein